MLTQREAAEARHSWNYWYSDFDAKTLRLLKMARAALIYLSLAIHREERERAKQRETDAITLPMPLDVWEDRWKI